MVALMKQAIIVFTESIISRSAAVPLPHMKNPTINALMSKTRQTIPIATIGTSVNIFFA